MRVPFLFSVTILTAGIVCLAPNNASVLCDEIRYDKGERRDPFIPLVGGEGQIVKQQVTAKDLHIEGVIFDPNGGSLVLIGGEFYKEGDNVEGVNVISIFKDRVILAQSDQEKTVWIRDEVIDEKGKK